MEKENLPEAVVIRVVLIFLILTALCLKGLSKVETIIWHTRSACKTGWDQESRIAGLTTTPTCRRK